MEFLLILIFILLIGIPVFISYFLFWFLKRRFENRSIKYFSFIPIAVMCYLIISAIFPSSEFFEEDFKEVTNLDFPKSSKIIYKDASYPDQFGDYTSVFAVKCDRENYSKIQNQLTKIGYIKNGEKWNSNEIDEALQKSEANIVNEYSKNESGGKLLYAAFLSDNQTIIFSRVSW